MGRRSVNTTKSGKFMNPTDQARKEARKRELKKNKKQRKMVREHVLKGKDPNQILEELEKLEELEIQGGPVPLPNDKAVKEKKRKLRETLDRLLLVFEKDDPARVVEIKRVLAESEKRKAKLQNYIYEAKLKYSLEGDNYMVSDIPMPDAIPLPHSGMMAPGNIPLPGTMPYPGIPPSMIPPGPPSTLPPGFVPPGPPPGPPPKEAFRFHTVGYNKTEDAMPPGIFQDDDGESTGESEGMNTDDEDLAPPGEEQEIQGEGKSDRHVRFEKPDGEGDDQSDSEDDAGPATLQDRLLRLAGQAKGNKTSDMDDEDHKDTQPKLPGPHPGLAPPGPPPGLPRQPRPLHMMPPPNFPQRPMMRMLPPGPPPGRPPGMPSGLPRGMPPRPPPGLPPNMPPPLPRGPLPRGPLPRGLRPMVPLPPGLPPGMMRPPRLRPLLPPPGAVLSAPPSVIKPAVPNAASGAGKQGSAVISAKPQLRNTQAELTRLVPVALRVKREQPKTNKQKVKSAIAEEGFRPSPSPSNLNARQAVHAPTKDDAYAQFMKEMEILL